MVYTSLPDVDTHLAHEAPTSTSSIEFPSTSPFDDDRREIVDLVDDDANDSCDDVVVISEGRREMKMTNDSGVGIVAEDLGAEEECYDDGESACWSVGVLPLRILSYCMYSSLRALRILN